MALSPRAQTGDPVSDFVHDLNNPLGSVHANLSQMAEYLEDFRQVWERVQELRKAVGAKDAVAQEIALAALAERVQATDADFLVEDLHAAVRESLAGVSAIRGLVREEAARAPRSAGS